MSAGIIYSNGSALTATAAGSNGQVLTSQGSGSAPIFSTIVSSGATTAFQAYLSAPTAAVTGDGTQYQIICDTVVRNDNSIYNATTGLVTFDQTGLWCVNAVISVSGVTGSNTSGNFFFENPVAVSFYCYENFNAATATAGGEFALGLSALVQATAGDTLGINAIYSGAGSPNVLISGSDVGTTSFSGFFVGSNSLNAIYSYKPVNSAASPYTVLVTDQYIGVDSSGGAVTILLPDAPTIGQYWTIKDATGSAATHNITISTVSGTVPIDAIFNLVLSQNYGSVTLTFNGTGYEVT